MARRPSCFDYVIVGAGSAGCALAARLSADPACSVLLIEAGGWDRDPLIHIPLGWGRILLRRKHDWGYFAEPSEAVGMRSVECARGKVIGGSSSTNAMAYVRGHRADFDRWAASYGLPEWSFDRVLPYFRRQESWEGGADAFRGDSGPLTTQTCRYRDPLVAASLAAAAQAGLPPFADYNGQEQEGFGLWQTTIRDGRRCSAAVAYLHPAIERPNLQVLTRSIVHRVVFERDRAKGVEFRSGRSIQRVEAAREVVLCGGAINTPQVLMLSGIGAAAELRRHGIPVRVDLPGVGANYQDHMSAEVACARSVPGPLHERMRLDRIIADLCGTYFRGRGVANDVPGGLMAFSRSSSEQPHPDIQLILSAAPLTARPYLRPFVEPYADAFAIRVVGLRPYSRGRIALAGPDPEAPPRIEANFLSDERDLAPLRAALRLAREILAQPALAAFSAMELSPGQDVRSDVELDAYIRSTALTLHHPAGSCRMGSGEDAQAVVDSALRVRGTRNLRIVDASVMPDLVSGNINAAVMMIAEKAADLIGGHSL